MIYLTFDPRNFDDGSYNITLECTIVQMDEKPKTKFKQRVEYWHCVLVVHSDTRKDAASNLASFTVEYDMPKELHDYVMKKQADGVKIHQTPFVLHVARKRSNGRLINTYSKSRFFAESATTLADDLAIFTTMQTTMPTTVEARALINRLFEHKKNKLADADLDLIADAQSKLVLILRETEKVGRGEHDRSNLQTTTPEIILHWDGQDYQDVYQHGDEWKDLEWAFENLDHDDGRIHEMAAYVDMDSDFSQSPFAFMRQNYVNRLGFSESQTMNSSRG